MGWVDVNTHSVSGATGNQSGFMDSSGFVVNMASKGGAVSTSASTGLPTWAVCTAVAAAVVLLLRKKG